MSTLRVMQGSSTAMELHSVFEALEGRTAGEELLQAAKGFMHLFLSVVERNVHSG